MDHREVKFLMESIAPVVRNYVGEALVPVLERIDVIEQRFNALPVPRDGTSVSVADVSPLIIATIRDELKTVPEMVTAEVATAVGKIAPAKDGKDADPEVVAGIVAERMTGEIEKVHAILEALPEPEELPDIGAMVQEAIAALPKPQDGKSVEPAELRPLIEESVSAAFSALSVPKDGIGLAGGVINRNGELVLTLSDGRSQALGVIIGKDGEKGEPGQDGKDGRDGLDGVGFDDLDVKLSEDERTVVIEAVRGENRKSWELRLPHVIDRGVFKDGETYAKGDAVSWGGSVWIARRDTTDKPETSDAWRLAVKRGRDGKDGKDGAKGDRGPEGKPGR